MKKKIRTTFLGVMCLLMVFTTVNPAYAIDNKKEIHVIENVTDDSGMLLFAASKKNGLSAPVLGKIKKTYDSSVDPVNMATGKTYTVKWNKVKGAKGYQVKYYEHSYYDGWYTYTNSTKKRSASISFSDLGKIGFRVRAYKIVNGKKKYGPWSSVKKKTVG